MPTVSPAQERLMQAAAHTPGGYGGVPQAVGREFVAKDAYPATTGASIVAAAEGATPIQAAGIIFLTPEGQALFVQRSDQGDYAGCWAFPGGKLEPGEVAEEAALREAAEEVGAIPDGERRPVRRVTLAGVDFTTFVQEVDAPFKPTLNDEHTAWTWAPITAPPEPLHPGVTLALVPLLPLDGLTELDIARRIADETLPSPTMMGDMALFALRMTGTGFSYRPQLDEIVWRDPDICLTPDFVARSGAGVPVLWKHAQGSLGSDEFAKRVIGSTMYAWIKDDEVWVIARIYDADAIALMTETQLSTSPAVSFAATDGNAEVELDDGRRLLIEGRPYYIDHLAICAEGVWDKGGAPAGVLNDSTVRADSMSDETEKDARRDSDGRETDKAREDAARRDEAVDNMMKRFDSFMTKMSDRMDAMEAEKKKADEAEAEKKKADEAEAEKKKAEDAKKDEADPADKGEDMEPTEMAADKRRDAAIERMKDEFKKREDALRADAAREIADVKRTLLDLKAQMPRSAMDSDQGNFAPIQSRWDDVGRHFGERAQPPMMGESPQTYEGRLAMRYQSHSPDWAKVELSRLDSTTLEIAARQIARDAIAASTRTDHLTDDAVVPRTEYVDGHKITRFVGRKSFIHNLKPPAQYVRKFGRVEH